MQLQTGIFSDVLRGMSQPDSLASLPEPEVRTSLENPQTPLSFPAEWLLDIWNGGRTDSGIRVSELTALQVSDVFSCVDLISSALASRPMKIYERLEVGSKLKRHAKRLAIEHPLFDILRYTPNDEMTAFTWLKTLQCHALLWGNAYAEIQRDNAARPVALWPRNPARTRPCRLQKDGRLVYKTTDGIGEPWYEEMHVLPERTIDAGDMIFVPGLSLDGRIGQGVVWLSRQVIGLALAAEKYAAKYFANGAQPGGILTHPGTLTPVQRENAKRSWMESQGGENIHRTALLENGIAYARTASVPSEAQMIEARNQQRSQIASIFHVPMTMLGEVGAARANAEQVALEFVNYTLSPWIECWEQEIKRKLLVSPLVGRSAGRSFMAVIDTRGLMLPDAASKQAYYTSMRQWSWGTANDVREMEDLNPVEGDVGEGYLVPGNMSLVSADGEVILSVQGKSSTADDVVPPAVPALAPQKSKREAENRLRSALTGLFRDAFGRFLVRKERDSATLRRVFGPVIGAVLGINSLDYRACLELFESVCRGWSVIGDAEGVWNSVWELRDAHNSNLFLARHGATDHTGSAEPDHTGDYPLNTQGQRQAERLAEYISTGLPKIAAMAGPDLKRNVQTMQAISSASGVSTQIDPALTADGSLTDAQVDLVVAAIESYRRKVDTDGPQLLVLSHHAIRAYINHLRGGKSESLESGHVGCCSLWSIDRDGLDGKMIWSGE